MTTNASGYDGYASPLAARNASAEMIRLWSPRHKFNTWRRIWLAIAEAQHEVTKGWDSPLVTAEQVAALRAVVERGISDAELERAGELERELRHDVMAHVHCLGESCPEAKAIIHLGCTSQDVVCNADAIILCEAFVRTQDKVARVISAMGEFAVAHRSLPTLGFTHYQSAQPTTVGRRCAQWAFELQLTLDRFAVDGPSDEYWVHFRGFKGATGTQASFLKLFNGDHQLVRDFEIKVIGNLLYRVANPEQSRLIAGVGAELSLTTQTYPRVVDTFVLADLASVASVLHKIATDIRLLSNRKEIDEPFGSKQIGSSAMPYKRNPMRCERICGLTRFVMNLVGNAYDTAATQWLERTLDDSSNRRLSLPEAFLALDGSLDLMHNVASGLVVHEAMVRKNLMAELPFLATENILMEAVKAGGDRQDLHEKIRVHAQEAGHRVKHLGLENDLLERLKGDAAFMAKSEGGDLDRALDWDDLMDPMKYVGRSPEQVDRFVSEVVGPLRERYGDELAGMGGSEPRV